MKSFKTLLTQIIERLHVHRYATPIAAFPGTFHSRSIIYQCECGKRKAIILYRESDKFFPVHTKIIFSKKEFDEILAGTRNPEH